MKIHTGDNVKVICGADRGKTGRVTHVNHENGRVTIENLNMAYKHVKRSQRNPQGGRLHIAMPMDASNVMVICPKTNKPTRVGYRYLEDGTKERYAKTSGESLGAISPPRKAYAKG